MAKYGETFLTRPRWESTDQAAVDKSPAQWAAHPHGGVYTLSLLGIINGKYMPLNWFGLCLVAHTTDDEHDEVLHYSIKKRWW